MFGYNSQDDEIGRIQYLGDAGITQLCIEAITRVVQCGEIISTAWLLSATETHAFVFQGEHRKIHVIRSGFRSGYNGEGPRGLATALQILFRHRIEIEELIVTPKLMQKLDNASLSQKDIDILISSSPVRPMRWHDYIFPFSSKLRDSSDLNRHYPLEIPFPLIDERIFDLALNFSNDSDAAIVSAYRRLEDLVRQRTGISESGSKLFSKAFVVDNAPLHWQVPDEAENKGRGSLFAVIYTAFRNARAHRELIQDRKEAIREFMLINELFLLEAQALDKTDIGST